MSKYANSCQLKPDDLLRININENQSKGTLTDLFRRAETVAQVSFCTCCGGTFQMSQANKCQDPGRRGQCPPCLLHHQGQSHQEPTLVLPPFVAGVPSVKARVTRTLEERFRPQISTFSLPKPRPFLRQKVWLSAGAQLLRNQILKTDGI